MRTKKYLILAALALVVMSCKEKEAEYDASGVFETTDVIVSAKGAGEILAFNVEEGQELTLGQEVGNIDSKQLSLKKTQIETAKAQNAAAKQQVAASKEATASKKMDVGPQVAALEQQVANLQREKARFEALFRDNAATEKQVSDIDYQIKTTQKQIAAVKAQYATTNNSIDKQGATFDAQSSQIDAQNSSVDAQISQINDQISNYKIVSPIAGTVLSKYAEVGEYAAPGRALFKVANIQDMKLRAYITADQLTKVKIGQKVKVYADQGTSGRKEYEGTIVWISTKAEFTPKTIQTRDERANLVYAIKIAVKNDGLIKRGMYGDVKF